MGTPEAGNFFYLNYMKVHNWQEWNQLEEATWKPLHEARVQEGFQKAWSAYTLQLPSGTGLPYNAGTADVFPNWEALGRAGSGWAETFSKVHPGKDISETMGLVLKVRDLVRRDLYEIVEKVTPSGASGTSAAKR